MKFTSNDDQLEALRAPFPIEEIKEREEAGKTLYYYEASTIMKRLVEVMGTGFSIDSGRIERYEFENKLRRVDLEVTVTLRWQDGTESRLTGWGSSDVQYSTRDTWRIVSDFMKSSLTDGIKVALSKIGVGSELYDTTYRKTLGDQKGAAAAAAREKAMFTCQECQGEIKAGKVGGKDLTQQEVAVATRTKFKKRLCIPCAAKTAKAGE